MTSLLQILLLVLDVIWFVAIVHFIASWLVQLRILSLSQPLVAQFWYSLERLMQPIYDRIRQFLPDTGGLDLAPLVLLIGIYALRIILHNNASMFL